MSTFHKLALSLVLTLFSTCVFAEDWREQILNQDRCLDLVRPAQAEKISFCYWRQGQGLDIKGYRAANWILRDAKYKKQINVDPELLDVLFIIQQWLRIEGRSGEIQILSGYRTPEHNFRLEGAAKQSLHMRGQAADIHVPAVSTKLLAVMGRMVGAGGIGIYLDKNFVHVDTGRKRVWTGK